MGKGAPDYSNVRAYGPLHRADDMAEMAARLGSPVTFHRGGQVIHLNTFEQGKPGWLAGVSDTGSGFELSTEQRRSGNFSMKLTPGTISPYQMKVYKDFAYPYPGNIGVEQSFTIDYRSATIELRLLIHNTEDIHYAAIKYDHEANTFSYLKSNGFFEVLQEDVKLSHLPNLFHTMKLVIDFEKGVYKSIWLDRYSFLELDYPLQTFTNGLAPYLRVQTHYKAINNSQPYIFIDDIIITQNE